MAQQAEQGSTRLRPGPRALLHQGRPRLPPVMCRAVIKCSLDPKSGPSSNPSLSAMHLEMGVCNMMQRCPRQPGFLDISDCIAVR